MQNQEEILGRHILDCVVLCKKNAYKVTKKPIIWSNFSS
nr:MAG TPA: hypothetical protein [Bacteriophage sp.]DAR79393.1 MAG TPA: hypothetical protein [Caudoviricetes sp.]